MNSSILRLSFLPIFFPNQLILLLRNIHGFCHSSVLAQSANPERYSLCHKIFFDWTCAASPPRPLFFQLQSLTFASFSLYLLWFSFALTESANQNSSNICLPINSAAPLPGVECRSQDSLVPSVATHCLDPRPSIFVEIVNRAFQKQLHSSYTLHFSINSGRHISWVSIHSLLPR